MYISKQIIIIYLKLIALTTIFTTYKLRYNHKLYLHPQDFIFSSRLTYYHTTLVIDGITFGIMWPIFWPVYFYNNCDINKVGLIKY